LARIGNEDPPILVAGGGFMGPPKGGVAQIGYSVLPQFQRQGYATEMVGGLVRWALAQPGVDRVAAETEWANPASARVLEKSGFRSTRSATVQGGARFELLGKVISDNYYSRPATTISPGL
jgi:RimJ/RimL family protein N-acetyltransferase